MTSSVASSSCVLTIFNHPHYLRDPAVRRRDRCCLHRTHSAQESIPLWIDRPYPEDYVVVEAAVVRGGGSSDIAALCVRAGRRDAVRAEAEAIDIIAEAIEDFLAGQAEIADVIA